MSLRDLDGRHLRLISLYSGRYAIRGGTGLVFFLLVLLTGLMIANLAISPIEQMKAQAKKDGVELEDERALEQILDFAQSGVQWAIGKTKELEPDATADEIAAHQEATEAEEAWARYLIHDRPALLSVVLLMMLFAMPFLVAIGAFNQFSGDVSTRGLRYQLLRSSRASIYFGRFLGTFFFNAIVVILLMAAITFYLGFKVQVYEWGDLLLWSFLGIIALIVVSLPYIALCSWMSASIDSPFGSLVICKLLIGAVPLFALIARKTYEPLMSINYLLPWGLQNNLLHPDSTQVALAVSACVGYAFVFLSLGYWRFSTRDL